nr:hypothetical protein [Tanacetum cinerariifolium]
MILKIKERISSSKKHLDLFKNIVFGKWLDFDDTNYDNHLLNYVLHHQRPSLSNSVDSNILFDVAGHTLLLGRAEFCLVTCFACGKVIFPRYLDGGIPLFVKRLFLNKLKKLEKNKDAWNNFPWGEYYCEEFHNKDSNPTTKLQLNDAEMGQNWYKRSYDYLDVKEKSILLDDFGGVSQDDESDAYTRQDGCGATVGAKVSGEVMNDVDISAIVHVEETKSVREIVLEDKVEFLEAKVEKLQLDHDKMAEDPLDAAIDGEHMDVVGHPNENEGPNEKEDPLDTTIINREHMDTIGILDETEEPNAQEPISYVLNTPVDNGDVLITNAPGTINLADHLSHESEITSPCGSMKKGDGLDRAKANHEDVPASQNTVKAKELPVWFEERYYTGHLAVYVINNQRIRQATGLKKSNNEHWWLAGTNGSHFINRSGYGDIANLHFIWEGVETFYVTGYDEHGSKISGYNDLMTQQRQSRILVTLVYDLGESSWVVLTNMLGNDLRVLVFKDDGYEINHENLPRTKVILDPTVKKETQKESNDLLFTLKIHHIRNFTSPPGKKYHCAKIEWYDLDDSETFLINGHDAMLEDLGIKDGSILFSLFRIPRKSLDEGLVPLMSNQDVLSLLHYVPIYKENEVYIEKNMMEVVLGTGKGVVIKEVMVDDEVKEASETGNSDKNEVKAEQEMKEPVHNDFHPLMYEDDLLLKEDPVNYQQDPYHGEDEAEENVELFDEQDHLLEHVPLL